MTDGTWIALHVHHHRDLTALMLDGLAPAATILERDGQLRLWHLVRYWNGGPHVRLRALAARPEHREDIRSTLCRAAEDYLGAHPSPPGDAVAYGRVAAAIGRVHDGFAQEYPFANAFLESIEPFHAGDEVLERPYTFDEARYGFGALRDIAEEHFAASTWLALTLLRAAAGRPGFVRAWSARLMAALPTALSLDAAGAARLFKRYRESTRYFTVLESSAMHRPYEEIADDLRAAIADASGRGELAPSAAELLASWRTLLAVSADRIAVAARREHAPQQLGDLLIDYVHMTNNRLGLTAGTEAYLADTLCRGFMELAS